MRLPRWSMTIRTSMALVALLACWLAVQVNRARTARRVIDRIERAGGDVTFSYELDWSLPAKPWYRPPAWMRRLLADEYLYDVVGVTLKKKGTLDHRDANQLRSFPRLRSLHVDADSVDPSILPAVAALTELRSLNLETLSDFPDDCRELLQLRNLKELSIRCEGPIGAGIGGLSGIRTLRDIDIDSVDDEGLHALAGFAGVTRLWIRHRRQHCRGGCHVPIASWPRVRELLLHIDSLDPSEWEHLASLKCLETLRLSTVDCTQADLDGLVRRSGLYAVVLFNTPIDRRSADAIESTANQRRASDETVEIILYSTATTRPVAGRGRSAIDRPSPQPVRDHTPRAGGSIAPRSSTPATRPIFTATRGS